MTFERMMDRLNKEKGRTAGEDNPPGVMRTLFVDDLSLSLSCLLHFCQIRGLHPDPMLIWTMNPMC